MTVPQADSTLVAIRTKIRRLTASSSESALTTSTLDQYINTYYNNDFPYSIKIDQMRSVYTFFTRPYIDRYPIDVNYNQGLRSPAYVEGIIANFYKDRGQFYALWPRFPTKFQQGGDTLSGTITGIAQPTNPTQVTSVSHNLITGAVITIEDVGGMTQLNGNSYTITVIDANTFSLDGIDNTAFGAYTSGGTWSATSQTFSFEIPGPFLSREVVIGGVGTAGEAISINDDGNGNLQYIVPNPVVTVPPYTDVYTIANAPIADLIGKPIPGMHNQNTLNPGLNKLTNIGSVDYVSGQIDFTLPTGISLADGTLFTVWVSQYQTGRPYNVLFWNNEIIIRPVPKLIHKVEIEAYLTPVQFMASTDSPILNQWWQLIAIGAAIKILEDRQDMEGVQNLAILFDRQEALLLERQGIEEIFQPNLTMFNSPLGYGSYGPWGNNGSW
jgi:hypothetical protein